MKSSTLKYYLVSDLHMGGDGAAPDSHHKSMTVFAPARGHIDPNLIATVQFCAIGLFLTLIVTLSFPNLAALIEQYNQF